MTQSIYTIEYTKDGKPGNYQIPESSELNALVRLGQIYGDDKETREDVVIEVLGVTVSAKGN